MVVQALPLGLARAVGRSVGWLAYALLAGQRRLALEHLRAAFGEAMTPAQRKATARRAFQHLGLNMVEWLLLPRWSMQQIHEMVSAEGVDHLRAALAQGNGAIVVSGHYGNWELMPIYMAGLGFKGGVLARRLRYPEYESFLITMRGEKGVPTLARGALKDVAKVLRAGQVIGMMPDQDIDSLEGVFVDFFGRPAHTPVGPAALSVMTRAPIVPCFIVREGGRFRLTFEPALRAPENPDRAQAILELTQAWSRSIEGAIRRHPDHWVWMHRRWKTQPAATSDKNQGTVAAPTYPTDRTLPAMALAIVACCLSLVAGLGGCSKPSTPASGTDTAQAPAADPNADQLMSGFTLTGYDDQGNKQWILNGHSASADGNIVTIRQPDGIGFDPVRQARLTAGAAQIDQTNRHVRLEHDVTIHTSDGLWLTTPVLHWIPDKDQAATEDAVRIETDHMLVRGRGLESSTALKRAVIQRDVEMVLNPSDNEPATGAPKHVTITCDGPLSFDYEKNIAIFEENVHVQDPNGDLYSDKLIAHMDNTTHTVRYAEAIGHVRIHQQQNTALSERALYEPAIGKITLLGKPSLLVYPSQGSEGPKLSFGGMTAGPAEPAAPPPQPAEAAQ